MRMPYCLKITELISSLSVYWACLMFFDACKINHRLTGELVVKHWSKYRFRLTSCHVIKCSTSFQLYSNMCFSGTSNKTSEIFQQTFNVHRCMSLGCALFCRNLKMLIILLMLLIAVNFVTVRGWIYPSINIFVQFCLSHLVRFNLFYLKIIKGVLMILYFKITIMPERILIRANQWSLLNFNKSFVIPCSFISSRAGKYKVWNFGTY